MAIQRFFKVMAITLPILIGAFIISWNTRAGLAVYSDSVSYLWAAHSVQGGHGFTIADSDGHYSPITFFPPLYPLALVAGHSKDVMAHARHLQIFLEITAIALAIAFVSIATAGSWPAMAVAGTLWAVAMDLTVYQSGVLSEGLFVVCAILSCVLMLAYLRNPKRPWLVAAGLATSAAWMTRYAGVSWMVGGAAVVFLLAKLNDRQRFFDTALFVSVASAANALWMHRNGKLGHSILGRPFHLTKFWGAHQLQSIAMTFRWWSWQPNKFHQTAYAIVYAMALVFFLLTYRGDSANDDLSTDRSRTSRLLLIYSAAYFGLIFLSAVCFQGDIFSDSTRLLIPLHLLMLLFVVLRLDGLVRQPRFAWLRPWVAAGGSAAVLLGLCAVPSVIRRAPNLMYALPTYKESPMIAALQRAPSDQIIYSNLLFPVELYVGHPCREIPHPIDNATQLPNPQFDADMAAMKDAIHHQGAIMAYFNTGDNWLVWPTLEEIQTVVPLKPLGRYGDGALFVDPEAWTSHPEQRYKSLHWTHSLLTTRSDASRALFFRKQTFAEPLIHVLHPILGSSAKVPWLHAEAAAGMMRSSPGARAHDAAIAQNEFAKARHIATKIIPAQELWVFDPFFEAIESILYVGGYLHSFAGVGSAIFKGLEVFLNGHQSQVWVGQAWVPTTSVHLMHLRWLYFRMISSAIHAYTRSFVIALHRMPKKQIFKAARQAAQEAILRVHQAYNVKNYGSRRPVAMEKNSETAVTNLLHDVLLAEDPVALLVHRLPDMDAEERSYFFRNLMWVADWEGVPELFKMILRGQSSDARKVALYFDEEFDAELQLIIEQSLSQLPAKTLKNLSQNYKLDPHLKLARIAKTVIYNAVLRSMEREALKRPLSDLGRSTILIELYKTIMESSPYNSLEPDYLRWNRNVNLFLSYSEGLKKLIVAAGGYSQLEMEPDRHENFLMLERVIDMGEFLRVAEERLATAAEYEKEVLILGLSPKVLWHYQFEQLYLLDSILRVAQSERENYRLRFNVDPYMLRPQDRHWILLQKVEDFQKQRDTLIQSHLRELGLIVPEPVGPSPDVLGRAA